MLHGAIRGGFPEVSSENLILLAKFHHHAKNEEWRHETESMRERTERNKTDNQSINHLTTGYSDHLFLLCVATVD